MLKLSKLIFRSIILIGVFSNNLNANQAQPYSYSIGAEGFYYSYREPGIMEDKGGLLGFNADFFYNTTNNWLFGAEGRMDVGVANYKSYNTGKGKNIEQFIFEPRFLFGYIFKGKKFNTNFYSGLGYRLKRDHSGGKRTTTGHYGYDRSSQYFYLPLGVRFSADFNQIWDWQGSVEVDILLAGRQKSELSQGDLRHKQRSGWGFKADYLVGYTYDEGKIYVGPFINFWTIKESNIVANYIEPKNRTIEAGLKAKYQY